MQSVTIGEKHMNNDFGVIMKTKKISPPEVQTKFVDIPMRDGELDLTEALTGNVKYKNRQIEISFLYLGDFDNIWLKISDIENYLHGKRLKAVFDDDISYYYIGRWQVSEPSIDRKSGTFLIVGNCEPYKYDGTYEDGDWLWDPFDFETGYISDRAFDVDGVFVAMLGGSDKEIIPTITTDADMSVTYDGTAYSLTTGKNKIYDIVISTGITELTFEGTGHVAIDYEGGIL
jgi:hypothetical protein